MAIVVAEADFQPAITRWGHAWRIALVVLISAGVWAGQLENDGFDGHTWLIVVDVVVGVAAFVVMLFRRRAPLAVAIITSALTAVSATASGPASLAMVSLATRRNLRPIGVAAAVNVAASAVYVLAVAQHDSAGIDELFGLLVPLAALVGWGLFVGSRRELVWNLRQRAERAEAEQELRAAEARATERTRIAREMHDVVAHRISQVSMRAGALAFRDDLSVAQMRAESEVIRDTANEALGELRSVLHVLRDPSSGTLIEQPQPTVTDIAAMVDDVRRAGAHIDLDQEISVAVPAEVGRTLYRIVQEGITNASKHAPGARLQITLVDEVIDGADGVALTMSNPLGFHSAATPGAGLGLVGIAERVAVAGGRFEHGTHDGRFVVRAWLPWAP